MTVEFDATKNVANLLKHGIGLVRFMDMEVDTAITREDSDEDYGERRFRVWGFIDGSLHAAVITPRGEKIRVISLRKATSREKETMSKRAKSRPDATNPEWTVEDFRNARPLLEVLPKPIVGAIKRSRGQRGPQREPTKELISLRLDREVLAALRATGLGWQTRANDTLRAVYVTNRASGRATTRDAAGRRRAVAKRRSSTAKRRA